MLWPELHGFKWRFTATLWKQMLIYSMPLLVLGVAGTLNQTIGTILYPHLVKDPAEAMYGLGIYGANYKIGIVLLIFLQAFRFAYEPFIFSRSKESGGNKLQAYRDAMKYFCIFALFIFLGVMYYIDIIRYFIPPRYFSGLKIVPLIMLGEFFFGIFFNLSIWYKLTDRTVWGAYLSLTGLAVTVALNVLLVPKIGYVGCAVAALCCYTVMMLASYFAGQRFYPIGYPVKRILSYFGFAAALYAAGVWLLPMFGLHEAANGLIRALLLAVYVGTAIKIEKINPVAEIKGVLHRRS